MLDAAFAWAYDPLLRGAEAAGLGAWRSRVLEGLSGEVLEVGAGTGLNLAHYPPDVRLTLLEPSAAMRKSLAARAGEHTVVAGRAEALPFEDGQFDAVVSGLVLCTVDDVTQALSELFRVLKPGGTFAFIEHVGGPERWRRVVQAGVEPVWRVLARGCRLTRDTEQAIAQAGFETVWLERARLPGGAVVIHDAILGHVVRP